VEGKGRKVPAVPLYSDVVDALDRWREQREGIPELTGDPWVFPRLGRQRRGGSFLDAGGELSTSGVIRIAKPGLPVPDGSRDSIDVRSPACRPMSGFRGADKLCRGDHTVASGELAAGVAYRDAGELGGVERVFYLSGHDVSDAVE